MDEILKTGPVRVTLALLLQTVCEALDAAQSTRLLDQHSSLLGDVPEIDAEAGPVWGLEAALRRGGHAW